MNTEGKRHTHISRTVVMRKRHLEHVFTVSAQDVVGEGKLRRTQALLSWSLPSRERKAR